MGFRFRKSFGFSGGRVNLSKRGLGISVGPKGFTHSIGPSGRRTTIGIPGTGVSYTTGQSAKGRSSAGGWGSTVLGLIFILIVLAYLFR